MLLLTAAPSWGPHSFSVKEVLGGASRRAPFVCGSVIPSSLMHVFQAPPLLSTQASWPFPASVPWLAPQPPFMALCCSPSHALFQVPQPQRRRLMTLPTLRAWLGGLPLPPTQLNGPERSDKKSGGHSPPEDITAERLAVALKLWRLLPQKKRPQAVALCRPLLPASGKVEDLFTQKHLNVILPALLVIKTPFVPHNHTTLVRSWILLQQIERGQWPRSTGSIYPIPPRFHSFL